MESDDEFQFQSSSEAASPQVTRRKLKRLKKTSEVSKDFLKIDDERDDSTPILDLKTLEFEAEDLKKSNCLDFEASDGIGLSEPGWRKMSEGDLSESSLGLDVEENSSGVKRPLEFDSVSEINELSEDRSPAIDYDSIDPPTDEAEKQFSNFDALGEEREAKRSKSKDKNIKSGDDAGNSQRIIDTEDQSPAIEEDSMDRPTDELEKKRPYLNDFEDEREAKRSKSMNKKIKSSEDSGKSKRILEKERREYIEQLRSESQRLLRETRGAAFKPVPVVQKPISSVLEKIRQRKTELSRKSFIAENTLLELNEVDNTSAEAMKKHEMAAKGREGVLEKESEDMVQHPGDVDCQKDSIYVAECSNGTTVAGCESTSSERTGDEIKEAFRAPIDDTQELFYDSQTSSQNGGSNNMSSSLLQEKFTPSILAMDLKLDDALNKSSSRLQENFTPSILAMNLMLDSAALDDMSDEEDNEKENVNPGLHGSDPRGLSNGDPVKAFVDDEAEEEDDSDHDLRFQDDEEDEDTDIEELHDMIATADEETPLDRERRDQLHQKFLEQQDAARTEDLLQRLNCGSKLGNSAMLIDENDDGDNDDFEFGETTAEDLLPLNVARMNVRKVKQMLPHMYTDKDDHYMSDDEETERRLANERVFHKADEKSTFLSPAEDESSREVFSLIKKLNIVPDVKKRHKAPSLWDTPLTGGNMNMPSKSPFLGRSSNLYSSTSRKNGSNNSRSYVFVRDTSNDKSAIGEHSDLNQSENKGTRVASAKFNYSSESQVRSSTPTTNEASGNSLLDILRQSSLQLQRKQFTSGDESTQTSSLFAAFKLDKTHLKKPVKAEGRF